MILHILPQNNFTIPFVHFINKEFDSNEHLFLFNAKPTDDIVSFKNVGFLKDTSRVKYNIIRNMLLYCRSIKRASKIIIHGLPPIKYFILSPGVFKKTYWIIYGYEIYNRNDENRKSNKLIENFILKRIYGHLTHIKGDSELANHIYKSSAKFFYTPMYLSNIVATKNTKRSKLPARTEKLKILVGNSTAPSNNHASIFKMLLPFKENNILIYCPLSYGNYPEYRDEVIHKGRELFGEKFVPMTNLMKIEEYNFFLEEIDIAIFNHYRQQAMGVTLTLLSMGKTVFMNSQTTSYKSFIERGIKVFDNKLIEREGLFVKRDVLKNPGLVFENYNYEILKSSLALIFND